MFPSDSASAVDITPISVASYSAGTKCRSVASSTKSTTAWMQAAPCGQRIVDPRLSTPKISAPLKQRSALSAMTEPGSYLGSKGTRKPQNSPMRSAKPLRRRDLSYGCARCASLRSNAFWTAWGSTLRNHVRAQLAHFAAGAVGQALGSYGQAGRTCRCPRQSPDRSDIS